MIVVHRFDEHGAHLYHMDPSGTYLKFDAKAIGSGSEGAQQSLQVSRALILKRRTRCSLPFSRSVVMSVLQKITLECEAVLRSRHFLGRLRLQTIRAAPTPAPDTNICNFEL